MKTANDTDTKTVLAAVSNGDSIPEGFAFAPSARGGPVFKLDDDEDQALQASVDKAGRDAVVNLFAAPTSEQAPAALAPAGDDVPLVPAPADEADATEDRPAKSRKG